jgi:hypothetical protein
VARPQEQKFLGFSFSAHPDIKRTIAPKSLERFRESRRSRGRPGMSASRRQKKSWPRICGAGAAISASGETPEVLVALTSWVRLRLRAAVWRQWKIPRHRRAPLIALGVAGEFRNTAGSGRGPWHLAWSKALSVGLSNAPLQIARSPDLDRSALAELLESPYTDRTYGGVVRAEPPQSRQRSLSSIIAGLGRISAYATVRPFLLAPVGNLIRLVREAGERNASVS